MAAIIAEPLWPQLTVIAAVAASHMSMPNHWLPYSLVARAHSWTLRKALFLTILGATGHVANTILISLVISEIGGALISHEKYRLLSSSILLVGGIYYLYTYCIHRKRSSCCEERQTSAMAPGIQQSGGESAAVHRTAEVSVVMLTALSPCVGSMPVLVSVMAPPVAISTVAAAGAVLLATSGLVMCALVAVSYLGAASMDFGRIRRHERVGLGISLIILAGLTFFVFASHHEHARHAGHEHARHEHARHEHAGDEHAEHAHEHASSMDQKVDRGYSAKPYSDQVGEHRHGQGHEHRDDKRYDVQEHNQDRRMVRASGLQEGDGGKED